MDFLWKNSEKLGYVPVRTKAVQKKVIKFKLISSSETKNDAPKTSTAEESESPPKIEKEEVKVQEIPPEPPKSDLQQNPQDSSIMEPPESLPRDYRELSKSLSKVKSGPNNQFSTQKLIDFGVRLPKAVMNKRDAKALKKLKARNQKEKIQSKITKPTIKQKGYATKSCFKPLSMSP